MFLNTVEKICALSCTLAILSSIQLLLALITLLTLTEIISITGIEFAIGASLLAGFVAIPTSIRLKLMRNSTSKLENLFGYTLFYQKMSLYVCLASHILALSATFFCSIKNRDVELNFFTLMKKYQSNLRLKSFIDEVQFLLQCCGSRNHTDWFKIVSISFDSMDLQLFNQPEKKNNVPFSCCMRNTLSLCKHEDINYARGAKLTINTKGCVEDIKYWVSFILLVFFLLSSINICLEVVIISLLQSIQNVDEVQYFATSNTTDTTRIYTEDQDDGQNMWNQN